MPINEPSWKIRSRLCPFYSRGKCFFAENCSFLHQTEGTPSATRVDDPGYSFSQLDNSNSGTGTSVKQPYTIQPEKPFNDINRPSRHYSNTNTEQRGSDSESDPDGEGTSDVGFPTIRKAILPLTGSTRASGFYRDSMATVKADSYGSETTSRVASFHSLPHHHPDHPKGSSFSNRSKQPPKISVETELSLSSLNESAIDGSLSHGHTPTSAISATAQEVEVPVFGGLSRTIPAFTLANSSSSSLIANRLAKSRGPAPHSPPIVTPAENPSTPFSAGALYASYYEEIPTPTLESPQAQDTEVDAPEDAEDAASPEHAPLASHVAPRTHAWLKPLRLASAFTATTGASTLGDAEQVTSAPQPVVSPSSSPSVSPGSSYRSSVAPESLAELHINSAGPSNPIPTNTPYTIVLSDHDGYDSPLMLSRSGSLDIDPSNFPPPPLSSATSVNDHSSPESISLSVLTGRSPRARPIPRITSPADHSIGTPLPLGKTTTPAEQLRSALERRARRIKESLMMLTSSDMSQINFNDETPSSEAQSLLLESTVATSVSHSRNISSASDFHKSISWNKPYSLDSFPRHESLPNTSTSASDTLLHQAQSSPPRYLGGLQPKPYSRSASPLGNAAVLSHTQSPDPSPRPELLFAIASDQPAEVERLLSTGKASANETMGNGVGLLEFTVTNGGLKNKTEIVKTLLKYGADPDALNHDAPGKDDEQGEGATQTLHQVKDVDNGMNPALKYYLNRQSLDIDSKPALDVLQQSSFAPLAKARFDIIGQDRALDELYRVLGTHSQRKGKNALVILLCGASGHGKSLLAQKVGSLLAVPTHTINMTALRSQHDLWQCLSTGMDDASPNLDLSEFLIENQGKRCVVVLDEIEKVDDSKSLNPLLLPWDIGRCSLEQKRHTDTSQVIWIATSNLGQKIIFEHVKEWGHPETPPTRDEYTQLATAIRRRIAEVLGASLLSRVTTILPFLPFTETEKIAIGTEAALVHQEFSSTALSSAEIEAVVRRAVKDVNFVEDEGARSLYRVVETHIIRARA